MSAKGNSTPCQTQTPWPLCEPLRYNVRGRPRSVRLPAVGRGQAFGVLVRRAGGIAERLDFVSLSRARPGMVAFWLHLLRIQKVERELRSREAGDARSLWTEGPVEVIPTPSYVPMAEPLCGPLRYSVRGRPLPTFAGMTSPHSAPFGRGPAELMRGWPSKRWKRNWIKADLRRRVSGDGRSCAGLRSALLTSPTAWTADRLLRPRPARTVS